jgi:dTDP-glucose 4,6-dehydratase
MGGAMHPLPEADRDDVVARVGADWEDLRGGRLLLTGGSGFIGRWLLESVLRANRVLGLGLRVVAHTRSAASLATSPCAADPALTVVTGDLRTFSVAGMLTHVIHAASPVGGAFPGVAAGDALDLLDAIVTGTRHVLDVAVAAGARRFLFTSSGAVYGPVPPDTGRIPETWPGGPDPTDPRAAYGEGKRLAELLVALHARAGLGGTIARVFALVGPALPLGPYAVGNFLRDARAGGPIVVQGDGTPLRSYLYAGDLTVALWALLARGRPGVAYNVGSDRAVSVAEVANTVADVLGPGLAVRIARGVAPGAAPDRYVPATDRLRDELGFAPTVDLREGIARMAAWLAAAERAGAVGSAVGAAHAGAVGGAVGAAPAGAQPAADTSADTADTDAAPSPGAGADRSAHPARAPGAR